mmetsp:Transcript_29206/g.52901  ORF Transcript_29206/g.52901 Transcript_29206/m.52901 type:complete len:290 (+) Transcript_29206:2297-3166(+)
MIVESWELDFMAFATASDLLDGLLDDDLVALDLGAALPVIVFCFFDLGGGELLFFSEVFLVDDLVFDLALDFVSSSSSSDRSTVSSSESGTCSSASSSSESDCASSASSLYSSSSSISSTASSSSSLSSSSLSSSSLSSSITRFRDTATALFLLSLAAGFLATGFLATGFLTAGFLALSSSSSVSIKSSPAADDDADGGVSTTAATFSSQFSTFSFVLSGSFSLSDFFLSDSLCLLAALACFLSDDSLCFLVLACFLNAPAIPLCTFLGAMVSPVFLDLAAPKKEVKDF